MKTLDQVGEMGIMSMLRGVALLRFPEVVKDLGERRLRYRVIEEIRRNFPAASFNENVHLIGYSSSRLYLGEGSSICLGTILAFGDDKNGYGSIAVGAGTWIGEYNNLRAGGGDIVIGSGCLISQFCSIVASSHGVSKGQKIVDQDPPEAKRGVVVGDDVWLGAGTTLTPGVSIGRGAVVGAGAVVTKRISEYEIWAGVPARKIGDRQ